MMDRSKLEVTVGSTALAHFGLNRAAPKDVDIWSTEPGPYIPKHDTVAMPSEIIAMVEQVDGFAVPDAIYTIKCSHGGYDIFWNKTKLDILWLKAKGCKLVPTLYNALLDFWKVKHGNKDFLSLNKSTSDFFNDFVEYKYDHDYLHTLVAWPNKPMYSKVLKDGHQVLIDKQKFFLLSKEEQVKMFREEMAVIACERWVLPSNGKISWFAAHSMALRKTTTTLTKGWASQFIVENLELFVRPEFGYVKHLLEILT